MEPRQHLIVGIDPGRQTGVALWDSTTKTLRDVLTLGILQAQQHVLTIKNLGNLRLIVMEDARLRTGYFGPNAKAKQQGAGSIKRDCSIWTEFGDMHQIALRCISPKHKGAKVDAAMFAKLTGWTGRTSEHSRDAAMVILTSIRRTQQ